MNFLVVQLVGVVSLLFTIAGFLSNKRKIILAMLIISLFLFSVHLYLLNAVTGAIVAMIGAIRTSVFLRKKELKYEKFWLYFFIALFLIVGLISWQNYYSLLPIIGMSLGSIGFWQSNVKRMRLIVVFASLSWLIYNIIVKSYPGIAREIITLGSVLIGMIKYNVFTR